MPDPFLMAQGVVAAAVTAALLLLVAARPWKAESPGWMSAGSAIGAAAGVSVGCWVLGVIPDLPPTQEWQRYIAQDMHRLLLLVIPAALVVELIASVPKVPRIVAWVLRAVIAFSVGRALLHGSVHITDLLGPGSAKWDETQRLQVFGALGGAILLVEGALLGLAYRRPSRSLPVALAIVAGGAALTVMLSGYATGGQTGLALSGALMAVAVASLLAKDVPNLEGALAIGVVGLGSLLIIGRFFGELSDLHAGLLMAAPLLVWATELPGLAKLGPKTRGAIQCVLVAGLVGFVVFQAQQEFAAESLKNSQSPASLYSHVAPEGAQRDA